MNIAILIAGTAIVTYIIRALPAVIIDRMRFGSKMEKFLSLIPITAMAALIFPGILTVDAERWYIGLVGGIVAVLLALVKKLSPAVVVVATVATVMLLYTL